jgi:hypothetical protein
MFIHEDYLVYTLDREGHIKIINLLDGKTIDVDVGEDDIYGGRRYITNVWPKRLRENILWRHYFLWWGNTI